MSEEWRTIPGFTDYEASNQGRIRRRTAGKATRIGRIKAQQVNQKGYHWAKLKSDRGQWVSKMVHGAVALAFLESMPDGHELNHIDGAKAHNTPDNLEWATHAQNMAHAVVHGLWSKRRFGEGHHRARLTDAMVAEAKRRVAAGQTRGAVAADFGVSRGTVGRAVAGQTWSHIR